MTTNNTATQTAATSDRSAFVRSLLAASQATSGGNSAAESKAAEKERLMKADMPHPLKPGKTVRQAFVGEALCSAGLTLMEWIDATYVSKAAYDELQSKYDALVAEQKSGKGGSNKGNLPAIS